MKSPTYHYLHSNHQLFGLIGSVNNLDTITCPSVSSLGAIAMELGMDIIVTYGTFSIIYTLVTTDVVGDNWCGHFGLWPFRSVAVSVCGRFGLWPFRFVAVPVCGLFGLWPFRFVAVPVCGRFGLCPFRLCPFQFVAVMTWYLLHWHAGNSWCLFIVKHIQFNGCNIMTGGIRPSESRI